MTEKVFVNCTNGGPLVVYVKDGKITHMRPLVFDNTDAPSWKISVGEREFTPPRKACLPVFVLAERTRVYSEDRILHPLKRIDFNPAGERHPEKRGISGYRRISWDEALDTVVSEMKRIRGAYGPAAITSSHSSHHNWGNIGYRSNTWARFFNTIGFTNVLDNPDSWEGWHWGATHNFGFYWKLGVPEQYDLLEDGLKNSEMIVHWGNDPDSTHGVYGGNETAIWRVWLRELGKKQVFIDPFCNYTSALMADKWLAPRPGTDAAMAEAIAYVWLMEDTYDKDYIATHTMGFEEFKNHILGKDDGLPRTPAWAQEICAVPARDITALAREWASKRTTVSAGARGVESSACRAAYGTEWARLLVLLQAMQGLGKPGVTFWGTSMGPPFNGSFNFPGYSSAGCQLYDLADRKIKNPVKQRLYRTIVPDAILNPPVSWLGETFCGNSLEQQFIPFTYPAPDGAEVRMFYRYGGSFIATMCETNKWVKMYQSPRLEFVVNQDCWWSGETGFADIILPACTNFERNDIGEWANSGGYGHHNSLSCNHRVVVYQQKCIEPLGESKSDYRIFAELSARLGLAEQFTDGGKTEEDWIEKMFSASDMPKYMSFEDFKKKGYFVVPMPPDYKPTPQLRWFYEGRDCDTPDDLNPKRNTDKAKELGTYSGKIEFVSQSLQRHLPDDAERPPLPRYIPSWEGYQSELADKYPLQLISPHPRFSFHTQYDTHTPWLCDIPGSRVFKNGYYWQVIRVHPSDAKARAIADGDVIRAYNDRGSVLGIARLTERMKPGVVHCYEGSSQYDPLEKGKPYSTDRGGCINMLSSNRFLSKNAPGMAPNSCLIEIEKWDG